MTLHRVFFRVVFASSLCLAGLCGVANAEPVPSYLAAVRQELVRLQLAPRCDEARLVCFVRMSSPRKIEEQLDVTVRVSVSTATVHMTVDELLHVEDGVLSPKLANLLLELSAKLVTAKLEWRPQQATVRLSTFVSTDSNFDRAAFRAQLLGLVEAGVAMRPRLLQVAALSADASEETTP